MAPDMTWKGSIRCFIFRYLKTDYIVHNRHNRPKKSRQSEKKNTPSKTKKRKKAMSKTGHLMNYFCLFVLYLTNSVPYVCSIVFSKSGTPDVLQGKSVFVSSFHQISKLNLESQRIERQLREELSSKCEVYY